MPLIKCKDCGAEVSAAADKCIKCGSPIKHPPSIWSVLKWFLIAIVVLPIAVCGYMTGVVINEHGDAEDAAREQQRWP